MPRSLLVVVGVPMTAGPDSVTVTPGSTPPWSSVTLPTSSPNIWPVCAAAGASPNASTMARAARARRIARVTGDLLIRARFVSVAGNDTLLCQGVVQKSCPIVAESTRESEDLDCAGELRRALPFRRTFPGGGVQ